MARILIGTFPAVGHVNPFFPLIQALTARGHEVVWTTSARYRERVAAVGARFAPMEHAHDFASLSAGERVVDQQRLRGVAALKADLKTIFIANAPRQVEDLRVITRSFAPDLILADPGYIGSLWFSELTGLPLAILGVLPLGLSSVDTAPSGLGLPPDSSPLGPLRNRMLGWTIEHVLFRDVMRFWNETRASIGLPATGWFQDSATKAQLYMQLSVPGFEYPRRELAPMVHFIGAMRPPMPSDWEPPVWWPELDSGMPIVHVTQGTLANSAPDLIAPALAGLAGEDMLVIVSTGGRTPEALGLDRLPANARVAPFLAYPELLPRTAAMVTNGGFGGTQAALAYGVPLVVAGTTEDKLEVAARVAWSGAGLSLKTDTPRPEQVLDAVQTLLREGRYRARAQALQTEYARYHLDELRIPLRVQPYQPRRDRDEIRLRESLRAGPPEDEDGKDQRRLYAFRGSRAEDEAERDEAPQPLDALAPTLRHAVLLGDPGSGKTEWLRRHTRDLAATALQQLAADPAALDTLTLPVFVRLSDVAQEVAHDDATLIAALPVGILGTAARLQPDERLAAAIVLRAEAAGFPRKGRAWLWQRLLDPAPGRVVLCLDAWDEARTGREVLAAGLAAFAEKRGATILLTSRSAGYDDGPRPLPGTQARDKARRELQICPFSAVETRSFVERFFHNEAETRERLLADLQRKASVAGMLQNPLMSTLVCLACSPRADDPIISLPLRRVEVYERVLHGLIGRWRRAKAHATRLDSDAALELLEEIAAQFFPAEELAADRLGTFMRNLPAAHPARAAGLTPQALRDEVLASGVLMPCARDQDGVRSYMFLHLTFQEYLSARRLARLLNEEGWEASLTLREGGRSCRVTLRELIARKAWAAEWQEVIILLAGCLDEPAPLLELLADAAGDDLCRHRLALAVQCLGELPPGVCTQQRNTLGRTATRIWADHLRARTEAAVPWLERALPALAAVNDDAAIAFAATLTGVLRDLDTGVRAAAARALERLDPAVVSDTVLTAMLDLLHDPNRDVRTAAVAALGQLDPAAISGTILTTLLDTLRDPNRDVCEAAATVLGRLGPTTSENVRAALVDALRDPNKDVRAATARALGLLGPAAVSDNARTALLATLRDPVTDVRAATARALGLLGPAAVSENVLTTLTATLHDLDRDVRWEVARALGQLGPAAASENVLAALTATLHDPNRNVRIAAFLALGQLGPAAASDSVLSALAATLRDPDVSMRRTAAETLRQLGPAAASENVLTTLTAALRDLDEDVRQAAAETLGQLGPVATTDSVLAALADRLHDPNRHVRRTAAETLGQLGPAAASDTVLTTLTATLRDPNDFVRIAAAEALWQLGPAASDTVLAALLDLLRGPKRHMRVAAAQALEQMGAGVATEPVLTTLLDLLRDPNRDMRVVAAWALTRVARDQRLFGSAEGGVTVRPLRELTRLDEEI